MEQSEEEVVGGEVMEPMVNVKVVPAGTRVLKNAEKEIIDPVTTAVTPLLINTEALLIVRELVVGVQPLKVSCKEPPEGI